MPDSPNVADGWLGIVMSVSTDGKATTFKDLSPKKEKLTDTGSKYLRTIVDKSDPSKSVTTDLYGIISGLQLPYLGDDGADAALHHCLKKCLFAGERGHKDTLTDLKEALVSLQRAIELTKVKE